MNLYKNIYGLCLRVAPSISSFLLLLCIDSFVEIKTYELWALDFILLYPIFMPFFRLGVPIYLLPRKEENIERKLSAYKQLQLVIASFVYLILLFGIFEHTLLIVLLSICGAFMFNIGFKKIRNGNQFGYLFQNVLVYVFVTVILLIKLDPYWAIMITTGIGLLYVSIYHRFKFDKSINELKNTRDFLVNYMGDVVNSFVVPILLFFSYKLGNQSSASIIFVLKITGFISGTVGGLIILNFKRLDSIQNKNNILAVFRKLKKELFFIYLGLSLISIVLVWILYPDYLKVAFWLTIFEGVILLFGQYNILIFFMKKKKQSVTSNLITILFLVVMFYFAKSTYIDIDLFVYYVLGATAFQLNSYLAYKYF